VSTVREAGFSSCQPIVIVLVVVIVIDRCFWRKKRIASKNGRWFSLEDEFHPEFEDEDEDDYDCRNE
jgi:hypothetical protein